MKVLEPLVRMIGQLSFRNKLRVTALLFGVPLLIMTGLLLKELDDRVVSLKREQQILSLQEDLWSLFGNLSQYVAALQGMEEGGAELEGLAAEHREAALHALIRLKSSEVLLPIPANQFQWLGQWSALDGQLASANLPVLQELLPGLRAEMERLNEAGGLLSDGEADSARLLDVVTTHLPGLVETTGQAAQVGTVVLAKQSIRGSRRNELTLYRGNFDSLVLWSLEGLRKVGQVHPDVAPRLEEAASQLNTAYAGMQEAITIKMLETTDFSMEPAAFLALSGKALNETLAVGRVLVNATDSLFAERLLILEIKRNFVIFVIFIGSLLIGVGFMAAYISIMRGLNGLSEAVGTMAAGNLEARVAVSSRDELGDVGQRFNEMAEKLAERTAEVAEKTHHIHGMLQNLPQGVLTITEGLLIHPEYSAYLRTIMESESLAGLPVLDVLSQGTEIGADVLAQQYATLSASLGEDRINFDFNAHLLLTELHKTMPDGRVKILELLWAPICDEEDVVEKVMLAIRDVTHLRELEVAAESQKRELAMIGQVLAVPPEKFQEFIQSGREFAARNRGLLAAALAAGFKRVSADGLTELFRNMHTIKGNARTYGLLHLTNVTHEAEQAYDALRRDPDCPVSIDELLKHLTQVEEKLAAYVHINEHVLGRQGMQGGGVVGKLIPVERADLEALQQQLAAYDLQACRHETLVALLDDVRQEIARMGTVPVPVVLEAVFDALPSLATELGKQPPELVVQDNGITLKDPATDLLRNVFMHLYRNALDHGLETANERRQAGKSAQGVIALEVALDRHHLNLRLQDDGRGLALHRIRQKAAEKGLLKPGMTDQALANLIFAAGFSTASQVTEVSGRGVGMDAVQAFLKRQDGGIELILLDGAEGADFRPFQTRIWLPANLAVNTGRSLVWQHRPQLASTDAENLATGGPSLAGLALQGA